MNQPKKNIYKYGAQFLFAVSLLFGECQAYVPSLSQTIVIDGSGYMVAAWIGVDPYGNFHVTASSSTDGVTWTTPVALTTLDNNDSPPIKLTLDSSGNCLAVFQTNDLISGNSPLVSSWLPNGGSWQTYVEISPSDQYPLNTFNVRINSADQVVLTWDATDLTTLHQLIYFSTTTFGSSWSTPLLLSDNS